MDTTASFGARIDVRDLFEQDRSSLLGLLRGLDPPDWSRPTAAAPWTVHDVVAHLLGDDLGRLARSRDDHEVGSPAPGESFPTFIHRLNDEWVRAAQRISPRLLIDLLEATSPQIAALWRAADLDAIGQPVSWAGPDPAPVWLDCARDFTEYWVHQQQIRDATDKAGGTEPAVVRAVLDVFLRAMPHTLADQRQPDGSTLAVVVDRPAGGRWTWRQERGRWWPCDLDGPATAVIVTSEDVLWRLCVRMIEPHEATHRMRISGERELATAALQIVSIIR